MIRTARIPPTRTPRIPPTRTPRIPPTRTPRIPPTNAAYADPTAEYSADPNAAFAAYDPNAPAPDGAGYDANAQQAWDPNQPWDPNAALEAQPTDPNAGYATDPNAAFAAYDPNAPADGAAYDLDPPYAADAALDPNAAPDAPAFGAESLAGDDATASWDASAVQDAQPFDPTVLETGFPQARAESEPGEVLEGQPIEDVEPLEAEPLEVAPPAALRDAGPFVADGAALPPVGWDAEPPLPEPSPGTPLGEYDETGGGFAVAEDGGLAGGLPLDGEVSPAAELGAPPALGEYDDIGGFAATPFAAPALEADAPGFEVASAPLPESAAGWPADTALDEGGFQLESGGSFGADADAGTPEWAQPGASPPWENAPALDLGAQNAPALAGDAVGYAVPDDGEPFGAPADGAGDLFARGEAELASSGDDLAGPQPADLALDVEGAPADGPAPELDFSHPDFSAEEAAFVEGAEPGVVPLEAPPSELDFSVEEAEAEAQPDAAVEAIEIEEEIPTLDGADLLEEITDEPAGSPPLPLDLEPLVPAAPAAILVAPIPAPAPQPKGVAPSIAEPPPVAAPIAHPVTPTAPACRVAGSHRVVVHTVEGQVKRGVLEDADLDAATLGLSGQPSAAPEALAVDKVKAIFFMLAPGEKAPAPEGKKVRVTFRDGRQVAGFSPDYDETGVGFFMIPGDTRTNTGRIWVYRAAVRQVAVS